MSHRNNVYREGIEELFDRSGISPEAVHGLVHMGHEGVPTSDEKLLRIASYIIPLAQEAVYREHESSVEAFQAAFIPTVIERTDEVNSHFQQRFEGIQ